MSLDVDLIRFTSGERSGQLGVCADRKLQVFIVCDQAGEHLTNWTDAEADGDGNPTPELQSELDRIGKFETIRRPSYDGFSVEELELVAKVARRIQDATGQRALCLTGNIERTASDTTPVK